MSIRDYGVREYGFILDSELLIKLLSKEENKEKINEFLDWLEVDNLEELDSRNKFDIAQEIGFNVYSQFTGEAYNYDNTEDIYFSDEDMFIIFLQKDSLFQQYKDWNEIFSEILNTLLSYGIKTDIDFIKEHTGEVVGSYWG